MTIGIITNTLIIKIFTKIRGYYMTKEQTNVPVWFKYTLTISEASEYFNIGEKKMRQLVQENDTADYILTNGVKVLIKRKQFEQFIDETGSI